MGVVVDRLVHLQYLEVPPLLSKGRIRKVGIWALKGPTQEMIIGRTIFSCKVLGGLVYALFQHWQVNIGNCIWVCLFLRVPFFGGCALKNDRKLPQIGRL